MGHIARNYFLIGGEARKAKSINRSGSNNSDGNNKQCPPRCNEPCIRIIQDGSTDMWCGTCGEWGKHFRADHPGDAMPVVSGSNVVAEKPADINDPSGSKSTSANI